MATPSPDITRARHINLIDYLSQLGHIPVRGQHQPHHALFHSPLRVDRNPSFSVSFVSNRSNDGWIWYDFANPEHHGDIIDFVQAYFRLSFKDALHHILSSQGAGPASAPPQAPPVQTDLERAMYARSLYQRAKAAMTPEREQELKDYFALYRLPYYAHLGAVWLPLGELNLPYIAFPIPSPNITYMQGLMCRTLRDVPLDLRRRFRGNRSPWVIRRGNAPILITESIIDCLAADVLFGPIFTLFALNGLPKPETVWPVLERLRPSLIYLALDNDKRSSNQKGPELQQELVTFLASKHLSTMEVQLHHTAGVKDLHRLWMKDPKRISLYQLTKTGIHHPVPQSDAHPATS